MGVGVGRGVENHKQYPVNIRSGIKSNFQTDPVSLQVYRLSPKRVLDLFDKLIRSILCYGGDI